MKARAGWALPAIALWAIVIPPLSGLLYGPLTFRILLATVPVFLGIWIFALGRQRFTRPDGPILTLLIAFMALFAVANIRNGLIGFPMSNATAVARTLSFIAVALFAVLAALHAGETTRPRRIQLALLGAPLAYVAANAVLYWVGWHDSRLATSSGPAQSNKMLDLIGLGGHRVTFPLTASTNVVGIVAGAALAILVPLLIFETRRTAARVAMSGAILLALYGVLASDTRGALIGAAIAILGTLLLRGRARRILVLPALLTPVSALIYTRIGELTSHTSTANLLSRGASGDVTNGRVGIWQSVLDYLGNDPTHQIVGHGAFGHVTTSLSGAYADTFNQGLPAASRILISTHNLGLQMALDIGWLGLLVVTGLMSVSIWRLAGRRQLSGVDTAILAGIVSLAVIGWTEAAPTMYEPEALVTWLLLTGLAIARAPLQRPWLSRPRASQVSPPSGAGGGAPPRRRRRERPLERPAVAVGSGAAARPLPSAAPPVACVAWGAHTSRADELAGTLGGTAVRFNHSKLRGPASAPLRYALDALRTRRWLRRHAPRILLVQNPPIFLGLVAQRYAALNGARFALDSHPSSFGLKGMLRWRIFLGMHRWLARRALFVLVTTDEVAAEVSRWGGSPLVLHEPPPRLAHAIDAPASEPRESLREVLFVSVFAADEPVAELVEAASRVPDVKVRITGDVSRAEPGLIASAPANVEFTGYLHGDEYAAALERCDLVVALTTEPESVVRAAYEAIYARKPLIASDWPALRDLFPHAVHVHNTADGLARGIVRAADEYPRLARSADIALAEQSRRWESQREALLEAVYGRGVPAPGGRLTSRAPAARREAGPEVIAE